MGARLEGSRVQWKPCCPMNGGWKGHGGSVAIGMAGSPVGVAGRPREDDQVVCVGILLRLGWEDVPGLGGYRLREGPSFWPGDWEGSWHSGAGERTWWNKRPAPPLQPADAQASWALSTSVALVLGVTGEWTSSLCHPLVFRTCQELEGSHLSQWKNTQGGRLEPGQRALWPQSSGSALSFLPALAAPTCCSQARSQRLSCVPRRPQVRSGSEKGS